MQPSTVVSAHLLPRAAALALLLFAKSFVHAQAADWEPPPPMPDEFDWVQLNSGEWLKGEIRVMYRDSLEFDSEELDMLTLDLEDIKMIRSAQIVNLRVRGAQSGIGRQRVEGQVATGKLLLEGDTVTVIGEEQLSFPRADILSVTAGVPRERNFWVGDITLGGNFRSGNTEQAEASTRINFQRRTVIDRIVMDHLGNYSRTNGVETANNQRGSVTWDRFRSEKLFVRPLFGEYYSDPFQNVELRYTIGTGAGYQIRDTSKTDWSVFLGPAYQETTFDEVELGQPRNETSWALSAGMTFKTDLTSRIEYGYDYNFQLTSEEAGVYNHHMISTLSFELTDTFDFDLSMVWDRIKEPRPNADGSVPEKDDYRLIIGIGYDF